MKKKADRPEQREGQSSAGGKKKWQEPKLGFVKPKLTKHGKLEEVTGQFFGAFSPSRTQQLDKPASRFNVGQSALYALDNLVLELHSDEPRREDLDRLLQELSWVRTSQSQLTNQLCTSPLARTTVNLEFHETAVKYFGPMIFSDSKSTMIST